jgi:hypothetical protein
MTGRNPFAPTDDQRRMVRALSGYGVPHDDIALIVKCSPPTLRKRFRQELDVGAAEATAKVAQTLFQQATSGTNTAAMIFWMKARAGWREKQVVEVSGKDGAIVPVLDLAIRYVSSEPLNETEWLEAHGNNTTAIETQQIFPPYKNEDR